MLALLVMQFWRDSSVGALILVRHGQSEWNAQGLWTGQYDSPLSQEGRDEARVAAELLRTIKIHKAYTSTLSRARQTLDEIKQALDCSKLPTIEDDALNERDYGDYTGKNKWHIKDLVGETEFNNIRRQWNYPIPGGETLKDVYSRTIPYFTKHLLDDLKAGQNILVVAHGNSLRSIMKYLERVDDSRAHELQINTAQVIVYDITDSGEVASKSIRNSGGKA